MNSRLRSAFVLLVLAGIGVALLTSAGRQAIGWERASARPTSPSPLIEGFESHRSSDAVETMLRARGLTWTVSENSALDPGDPRPPFSVRTLRIAGYSYLGHSGELRLQFFNDRLMRTSFFADDPTPFLRALEASLGCELGSDGELRLPPRTRIHPATDATNRPYVSWEDIQLEAEESAWIQRYS